LAKLVIGTESAPRAGFTRVVPADENDPTHKYRNNNEGSWSQEWGTGPDGYKAPAKPAEKMKKNLPYKVRSAFLFFQCTD
jgi:nucleobindin